MFKLARRPPFAAAALFLLVVLGGAQLAGAFVHGDDGCPVETHCPSCRWVVSSVGVVPPHVTFAPVLSKLAWVACRPRVHLTGAYRPGRSSRDPPEA